jgi:hypothetical protein
MDLSSPSFLSLSALELEADDSSVNTTRIVRVVKNREGGAASRTAPPPWPGLGQYCGESVMHSWSRCASAGDYAAASHLELLCSRWRPSACRHMEIDWGIGTGRRKGKTRQGSNRERGRDGCKCKLGPNARAFICKKSRQMDPYVGSTSCAHSSWFARLHR